MVLALMIMAVLVLVGAAAINTSIFELQIAGSDAALREAFYEADGGADYGIEILENNIACITGFGNSGDPLSTAYGELSGAVLGKSIDPTFYGEGIFVPDASLNLWLNFDHEAATDRVPNEENGIVDAYYPYDFDDGDPYTMITIAGDTRLTNGSAIQMAAGYEGKGKGIGSGGAYLFYQIYSTRIGNRNSTSTVRVQWRHSLGSEGDCYY